MNAYQVLKDLKDGNKRFLAGTSEFSSDINLQKLKTYAEGGQSPKAIILCCSDSRAPVEMIFDQHLGDLFVIRVAGNIVAPSLIGSVEFATAKFGTNLVIVMGHTQCGAINATIEHLESIENVVTENILDIIGRIKPRIQHIVRLKESRKEKNFKATIENAKASVEQLKRSSALLEKKVLDKSLIILGAIFHLETGEVEFFEEI